MIQRTIYFVLLVSLFVLGVDGSRAWADDVNVLCSNIDRVILVVNTTNNAAGVRVRVKPREGATTGKLFNIDFTGQSAVNRASDVAQSLKNCEFVTFYLSSRRYAQDSAIPVNLAYITVLSR